MSKIDDALNKIMTSRYGKDVRQSIHDGIEQCYVDAHSVEVSDTEPTDEYSNVWVDPNTKETFSIPEIKDDEVSPVDTWSSEKIDGEIGSLSEDLKNLRKNTSIKDKVVNFEVLPVNTNGTIRYNSASYIQDNTVIYNGFQYAVLVNENKNPIILKRKIPNGEWSTFDLSTIPGNPLNAPTANDQHNIYSMGIDKNGYIHIAGNMHADKMKYIVSSSPENISSWEAGDMIGTEEDSATYPAFVVLPNQDLIFLYRNGTSSNGNVYVNLYNSVEKKWNRQSQIFNGSATNENAYINHVAVDNNTGYIHLMYCWRSSGGSDTNNDICYCVSKDSGKTWAKTDGTLYEEPITHNNAEIVVNTEDSATGLLNQSGLDVDINGNPHGCFMMYDENGYTQYYHVWFDGNEWHNDQITQWKNRMEFTGGFTDGKICRPSIAISKSNRIFVIYRNAYLSENTLRIMEILQDNCVIDFDVVDLNLHNYEYSFDYKSLKTDNKLISIVSNAIAGSWIENSDKKEWWEVQYGALLTLDLNQIDSLINGTFQIPKMKINNLLRACDYPVNNVDFSNITNMLTVVKKGKPIFLRATLSYKSTNNLSIGYEKSGIVTSFISVEKTENYDLCSTPWILIPQIESDEIINIVAKGNGDIKLLEIELGCIDNSI